MLLGHLHVLAYHLSPEANGDKEARIVVKPGVSGAERDLAGVRPVGEAAEFAAMVKHAVRYRWRTRKCEKVFLTVHLCPAFSQASVVLEGSDCAILRRS